MLDTIPQPSRQPSPPSAPKRTAEEWAEAKGHLPQWMPRAPVQRKVAGKVMQLEQAPEHNAEHWRFAAAKHLHGWHIGHELTEAEFDAAIDAAANVRLG